MAVKRLTDGVDEKDIIDLTDVEELNEPNILIDEEFGITGKYSDYAVVQRKVAHRTGKEEDGVNKDKVIRYIRWEDCKYSSTISGCLEIYKRTSNLNKISKLKKCRDFAVIESILKETNDVVDNFLKNHNDLNSQQTQIADMMDIIDGFRLKIKEANKVFTLVSELHELVKAKRKIVIDDTEPKKPKFKKVKEEEED